MFYFFDFAACPPDSASRFAAETRTAETIIRITDIAEPKGQLFEVEN